MLSQFRHRSLEPEHLDKGDYTPEEYEGCIHELQRVNQWLGDAQALRSSLLREIEKTGLQNFSVVDVGAGSGELLRVIAEWGRINNRSTQLLGVELNARSARAIAEQSASFPEIRTVRADGLHLPFADNRFDYAICSLFTHHFDNDGAVAIVRELSRVASRGIFVIDLHRHPVPYYFFTTIARSFLRNRLIREDGALSILRSFTPFELADLGKRAGLEETKVTRRFPYRLVLRGRKKSSPGAEAEYQAEDPHASSEVRLAS
jgi:SAM-dependent methyltransferase